MWAAATRLEANEKQRRLFRLPSDDQFLYYALVLLFSMCLMHPVYLAISLTGALAYDIYLKGRKAVRFAVMGLLPMAAVARARQPGVQSRRSNDFDLSALRQSADARIHVLRCGRSRHAGKRRIVVFQLQRNHVFGQVCLSLWTHDPRTVIGAVYGLALYPEVQGADADGQRSAGVHRQRYEKRQRVPQVFNAIKIFSIMVTWSLENAIETADSMRSRGYGLPGRTAFSIYRFDDRDKAALAWLIFCGAYLLSGWMAGGTYFRYYPTVKSVVLTPMTVSFMCVYLALVLTPVILDRKEDRQWNSLQSTI